MNEITVYIVVLDIQPSRKDKKSMPFQKITFHFQI